jgi:chromosome segregation ATPase
MADQDKFRFHLGDEEPEPPAVDEALQRRVHTLGQRVSFLTLVLPCLLAVVVFLAYREIEMRVTQAQQSDGLAAQRLAADLAQKNEELRERLAELDATLAARWEGVQAGMQGLQGEIKGALEAVQALNSSKTGKSEWDETVARVDAAIAANANSLRELSTSVQSLSKELQAVAPFREELGSAAARRAELGRLAARLQSLENSLGKDLTGVAGFMERNRTELAQIKSELAKAQSGRADREYIDLEILKAKKVQQTAMEQELSRIEKMLSGLQRRIDQLERAFSTPAGRSTPPPAPGTIREQPLQ